MPAVVPAVAAAYAGSAVAGAVVAAGYAATAAAIAGAVVSAGVGLLGQRLLGRDRDAGISEADRGRMVNVSSPEEPIPIIYGRRRVGGPRALAELTGADNRYFHLVIVLCEGPIDAVEQIYLNDKPITDSQFSGLVEYTVYLGSETQAADTNLVTDVPGWTIAHRLLGTAYIRLRLRWDLDAFPAGLPVVTADVRGRTLYDPRDGTTAWSENPALAIRDYLTHTRYGRRAPLSRIMDATFSVAANVCDELVSTPAGSQRRYRVGAVLSPEESLRDNLLRLAAACRGLPVESAGRWRLLIDQAEVPSAFGFSEDNIVGGWAIRMGSKRDRYNRVRPVFIDAENEWQPQTDIVESAAMLSADGGALHEGELDLRAVTNLYQAQQIAGMELKQSRQGIRTGFTATIEGLRAEVGDVVPITHSTPGWVAKPFRILKMEIQDDEHVRVEVQEYDDSVYDLDNLDARPVSPDTNLPDPYYVGLPSNLQLFSGTEDLLVNGDGTVVSRLRAVVDAPDDAFVIGYEWAFKPSIEFVWTPIISSAPEVYIAPVSDGQAYDVRVRAVNAMGRRSGWVTEAGHTVIGKSAPPPDVQNFLVETQPDGTRQFTWTPVFASDLAGYRLRYFVGDTGDWNAMLPLHDGVLTSSPWETNQLAAGAYTFALRAVDTTGNESTNPAFIDAVLDDPRLAGVVASEYPHGSGWPGTKTDCHVEASLLVADNLGTWDDLTTWDAWTQWPTDPAEEIVYEHTELDIGVNVTVKPIIRAIASDAPTIEIDTSVDGVSWTGWVAPPNSVTMRYIRVRVTVAGSFPILRSLQILLSGNARSEQIQDLGTASLSGVFRIAAGDIRLPVPGIFDVVSHASLTLQNVGPGWSWELIDKDTTNGPRMRIYNGSGVLADATIDATIRGF